jgi:hypothetical protein
MSQTKYLSVADNARDAVLLHVSASSERQEPRNKTDAITETAERHICGPSVFCLYSSASCSASYINYVGTC